MNWLRVLNKREFWKIIEKSIEHRGPRVRSDELSVPSIYSRNVSNRLQYYLLLRPSDYVSAGGNQFAHLVETVELGLPGTVDEDSSLSKLTEYDRMETIKERLRANMYLSPSKNGNIIIHNLHMEWKNPTHIVDENRLFPNRIFMQDVEISHRRNETRFYAKNIIMTWNRGVAYPSKMTLSNVRIHTNDHNRVNLEEKNKMKINLDWKTKGWPRFTANNLSDYSMRCYYPSIPVFHDHLPGLLENFSPYEISPYRQDDPLLSQFQYLVNEEYMKANP